MFLVRNDNQMRVNASTDQKQFTGNGRSPRRVPTCQACMRAGFLLFRNNLLELLHSTLKTCIAADTVSDGRNIQTKLFSTVGRRSCKH